MDYIDTVVVGAGVVGLACARALALSGREVMVLEAEPAIGMGVSSRNSEVIHAGIYYRPGSLKATLCVQGRERLYAYCQERDVPHENCGKLIVATTQEQLQKLKTIQATASQNGVQLELLDQARACEMEPNLFCTGALWSPTTGIVDTHGLMLSLQGDLENAGGMVVFNTQVERAEVVSDGVIVHAKGADPLKTGLLVNCAALGAQTLAEHTVGFPKEQIPALYYARGCYYSISGTSPFSRLFYPSPEVGGLGVHLTIDLGHQAKFGPDIEWIDEIDYTVDPKRADRFYAAIRSYWPALPDGALQPAYAGIRPKIQAAGEPEKDFVITGPGQHGVRGIVQLFGIESPGLTASLAIGDYVTGLANSH